MIERFLSGPRMSQIVVYSNTIYISGQVAEDTSGDIAAQTDNVLAKIDRLLAEVGTSRSNLLSVTVLLPHIADFEAMNAVYDKWIDLANPPARACYEARLADPDLRIEVVAVAAMPEI